MTEGNVNQPDSPTSSAAEAKRAGRRLLIKAALLATPLIVTLRGKPAHAQLSSLGSVETPDGPIMYGPGAYVTQQDIDFKTDDNVKQEDLGKAIKPKTGGGFEILEDKTRRSQKGTDQTFDRAP